MSVANVVYQMMECVEQDLPVRLKDLGPRCDGVDGRCEDNTWTRCDSGSYQDTDQLSHAINGHDSLVAGRLSERRQRKKERKGRVFI